MTQQKFNLLHQIDPERSLAYNQSFSLQMKGKIDASLLKIAVYNFVDTHNILRTRVSEDGVHLIFDSSITLPIEEIDFSKDGLDQQEKAYKALVDVNMHTAFSFTKGPLMRLQLVRFSSEETALVVTMHHIIADGWSCALFIKGIANNYNSLFQGKKLDLLQPVGFNEYTKWLENKLSSDAWKVHEEYFINKFSKKSFNIVLPFDNSVSQYGNAGKSVSLRIPAEDILRYKKWSSQQNLTLFMTFLSAFELLLCKITEKNELIIGIPTGGRTMPDIQEAIGDFSHFMPFLISHNSKDSLTEYVKDLKNRIYETYEHQEYPYASFMELLQKETDIKYDNWVNVVFNFNVSVSNIDMESVDLQVVHNKPVYSDFDLMFNAIEESGDLVLSLDYRESFLSSKLAKDILDCYQFILNQIIESDGGSIGNIQLLSEDEKEQQLKHFNNTEVLFPKDKTIVDLFEEQVLRMPESIAVVFGKKELTYKELDEKSNQIAHYLIGKGLSPEDLVGICVNRSFDMIIAVFGVLKAGGTYVPIDAEYPEERIHYIIEDSNTTFFITDHAHEFLAAENKKIQIITTDDSWNSIGKQPLSKVDTIINGDQSVYVIYTSGSTGRPKGVVINHTSLLNMALCWESSYHLDSDTCLLQMASFSFDVFSGDLCRSLLFGGRMVLCPSDARLDPARLYDLILEKGITILEGTPGLVIPLMDYIYEQSLDYAWMKLLILGSDVCNINDFKRVYSRFGHAMRIINSYGTTETTIDSSYFETDNVEILDGLVNVPVGKPLWNNSFYILNTSESLVPIGVIGELCIGGAGVARGYLNKEELTREKFVANPFKTGERMYKTGDLARWLPDGNLEFIGRKDDQVKIRGYRIELGEIENALSLLPEVTQCCVLAREDVNGAKRLIGYVVAEGALDKEHLQNQLKQSLPEYMIPMIWIALDAMPLTSNGKLDKKGLPDPDSSELSSKEYAEPTTDLELQLVNLWQELLGVERVGIHDDFFELGGHSLLATRLVSIIRKELTIEVSIREIFIHTTVSKLGTFVSSQSGGVALPTITVQDRPARIPLSFSQERLWFLDKLQSSTDYHIPVVLHLEGPLDIFILEKTLQQIVYRHEVLRSVLLSEHGIGYQEIISAENWSLDREIVSDEVLLQSNIADYLKKPFDLSKDYMLRCCLYDCGNEKYVLASVFHHIASDGWSGGVLVNEFMKLYNILQLDRTASLPKLSLQYADYAIWQRKYVVDTVLEEQLSYWEEKLQDVSTLALPMDYARPSVHSTNGASISSVLDKTLTASLDSLCRSEGVTLFMFLLSAFKVLLSRYSGQSDICVGTPIANRTQLELEDMIGFFVNTIALRSDLSGNPSFSNLLARVKQTTLEGYDHQLAPFEKVVDRVVTTRDMSMNPLFQVLFVLQNTPDASRELSLENIKISNYKFDNITSQFDLMLNVFEDNNGISLEMSYCTALFDKATIESMLLHYQELLQSIVSSTKQPISTLSMLSQAEEHQLLNVFNNTEAAYPSDKTIVDLFIEQVKQTPNAVAVVYEDEKLTYKELDQRSNQLAHYLREQGVKPDALVGICLERSLEMLIGILGILKSGGAYVPIDPEYPTDRIAYMLKDAGIDLVVSSQTSCNVINRDEELSVLCLDKDWELISGYPTTALSTVLTASNLAYVIYTSGSTGTPKGVLITHKNVVRLFKNESPLYDFGSGDVWTLFHSFCFDFSVWEMYGALLHGGRLVVVSKFLTKDAVSFKELLIKEGVTVLNQTPGSFYVLQEEFLSKKSSHSLRYVIFGGEALNSTYLERWKRSYVDCKLINMYGITETTVHVTYKEITESDTQSLISNIGTAIPTLGCYIVDAHLNLVPIGVEGELCISGAGVARGYLNREDLTNEKFIANPFSADKTSRLYRSGDLARWLPDGNIEYIGRKDDQVKIRGYRIELGEIENALSSLAGVTQCCVLAKEDTAGNKRLVGYVVLEGALDKEQLQNQLKLSLPQYMVPQLWVALDTMPLTGNGKLDKKALPDPDGSELSSKEYVAPRNETETQLAEIWQNLLGVEQVGIHDNFFELGGHSLLVVQLISRLQALDFNIAVKDIFAGPTIASIGDKLSSISFVYTVPANGILVTSDCITPLMVPLLDFEQNDLDKIVAMVPGGISNIEDIYPLSPLQEGIYFHHLMSNAVQGDPYILSGLLSFSDSKKRTDFIEALQFVVNRHDILRTSFLSADLPDVVQVVLREAVLPVELLESSNLDNSKAILPQLKVLATSGTHWMDTSKAPLLELKLTDDPENESYYLVVYYHHLIMDHVGLEKIMEEVMVHLSGEGENLSVPFLYRDFIGHTLHAQSVSDGESYFRSLLGAINEPTYPFNLSNALGDGTKIEEATVTLSKDLSTALRTTCVHLSISPAVLFHAAFGLVIARCSNKQYAVFGSLFSGRLQGSLGAADSLGLFINTLPVALELKGSVMEYLEEVKLRLGELLSYEQTPLSYIQDWSGISNQMALFSALLNYRHSSAVEEGNMKNLGITLIDDYERTNYPFNFIVDDFGIDFGLTALVDVNIGAGRILQFMEQSLIQLIDGLTFEKEVSINTLNILSNKEKHQLLDVFNDTDAVYPVDKTIIDLFVEQVKQTPNAIAIVYKDVELTYKELDKHSNQLAHYLLSNNSIIADSLIGVVLERSEWLIISFLAILKTGAAYVPIDSNFPEDRKEYIKKDSNCSVVIDDLVLETFKKNCSDYSDDFPEINTSPDNLAYIIYTSGSTGKPKGVMIEHRNIVNTILSQISAFSISNKDSCLQFASISFDASIWEIGISLLSGSRLCIIKEEAKSDVTFFRNFIANNAITFATLPPAFLQLLAVDDIKSIKTLVTAGESIPLEVAKRFSEHYNYINAYGPTEASICSTTFQGGIKNRVSIGKPIDNTQVYVMNEEHNLLPVGVVGELCVGGAGVARGYLNLEQLTKEKFINNPFIEGERIYKTGDLARWLPDGNLEFIGRKDDQVKIRGYRIELGEIENVLSSLSGVVQCCVLAKEDLNNTKRLVGYVVPEGDFDKEIVQNQLKLSLPEYMVPQLWVTLEVMPLTTNGKLDKKALPDPDSSELSSKAYVAPRNETEEELAIIWKELLEIDKVGIHDNFFELGGHSLLATRLVSMIRKKLCIEVTIKEIFEHTTITELAAHVSVQSEGVLLPNIIVEDRPVRIPLSFSQERLWFLDQLQGSTEYHIPIVLRLEGVLEVSILKQTLQEIVSRHEVLRSMLLSEEGIGYQEIISAKNWSLDQLEIKDRSMSESSLRDYLMRPFDLSKDYKLRACLYDLGDNQYVLAIVFHHIASDGWSGGILTNEFMELYNALQFGHAAALPELSLQYTDYAIWQRKYLEGIILENQLLYWEEKLRGVGTLSLPTDHIRPSVQSSVGASVSFILDKELSASLESVCKEEGVTLFMLFLSIFKVLLFRYTGQEDVCVGTPIANRTQSELEGMIGFFVNTLALRSDLSGDPSFRELLAMVKQTTLEGYDHQLVPFEKVVDRVVTTRDMSMTPLFQVMFIVQNASATNKKLDLEGVVVSDYEFDMVTTQFDLTLNVSEEEEGISLNINYSTALFEKTTIDRMLLHYQELLKSVVADTSRSLGNLSMLTKEEQHQLLDVFNNTDVAYPKDRTVIDLFTEQVKRTPAAIAVVYNGEELSYKELDQRSNQLGHYLQEKGVKPDALVGICLERSLEMFIGILGILKSGGAYVPIDPDFPRDRLNYMLTDAGIDLVLSSELSRAVIDKREGLSVLSLDSDWDLISNCSKRELSPLLSPSNLAYVIYTSGSTGVPKGVPVVHTSLVNFLLSMINGLEMSDLKSFLSVTTYTFDIFYLEFFTPLLLGAKVIMLDSISIKDADKLQSFIADYRPDFMQATPSTWQMLIDNDWDNKEGVTILTGGEAIKESLKDSLTTISNFVWNLYGPTEATIWVTAQRLNRFQKVNIGRAIDNVKIYIVDNYDKIVPLGVIGELCIGGVQVARGYLNREELTNEKFISNLYKEGERVYRTGDLARWLPDGNIELVGRKDDQVKIRGYRIELGEIENVLSSLPGVAQCCVLAKEDSAGSKRLVGYVVPEGDFDKEVLQEQLKISLPEYMVPQLWVTLETMPLTSNGKLDKKSLPNLDGSELSNKEYVAPRNETEAQLAEIWQELLGIDKVGIHDNFFELGGHSLLATRLVSMIRRELLIEVSIRNIFRFNTVEELASYIIYKLVNSTDTKNDYSINIEL
ncbi:amino acid adenylation domain-containing protein [Flavobacterium sp. B183]|nr:amino acid adenylation domain-containing protein [Flavobacterium sp. B183]